VADLTPIRDLSQTRILVTNDDGYAAPGIEALERIARAISDDVWVVAPETEQSATSHSLTLRRPLRVRQYGPQRYTVDGTPTDSVLVAARMLLKEREPDLVLSGINMGSNLGEDVTYSGTVAAAMEGAILGYRAIAFSQARDGEGRLDFAAAERYGPEILRKVARLAWHREMLINVNFPAKAPEEVAGIRICVEGRRESGTTIHEGKDPSGKPYVWIGQYISDASSQPGSDLRAVAEGAIAVSPLHLDMTHVPSLKPVAELFDQEPPHEQ